MTNIRYGFFEMAVGGGTLVLILLGMWLKWSGSTFIMSKQTQTWSYQIIKSKGRKYRSAVCDRDQFYNFFDKILFPSEKIDTLCLLVQRIVEENKVSFLLEAQIRKNALVRSHTYWLQVLKNEITVVGDQCEKQREAKEVLATLNTAYKKQVGEKIEQ